MARNFSLIGTIVQTFWILVEHHGLAIFLSGLAAPFLLVVIARGFERSRAKPGAVPHFGFLSCGGFAVGSILGLVLLVLAMCSPPSGKGETAEAWMMASRPVILALDRYRADSARYPDALGMLVPGYLDSASLPHNDHGFTYRLDSARYELGFHYTGPGMNHCTLRSAEQRWSCSGYY
ncbi:MAG TPA: hypothetical protein VGO46_08875 [Gemmatimonadaceae bacterium]|nr:hypothetical protein [Gemmatimonadaceae bacterium]